jgi:transposase, IS30 family
MDARANLGLLKAGNERRLRAVGCETIYAFIYRAYQKTEQLWRSMNGLRLSTPEPRPAYWEGDLIICKRTRLVLVLHERKSRVTLAARLIGKTAAR